MRSVSFRVKHGDHRALERTDPGDTGPFTDKADGLAHLEKWTTRLDALQERLYASDRYSLLLIFQGLDAAGKDSAIRHVLSGVNPAGTQVQSFKVPSSGELAHDFLWRAVAALPARGRIGIFNRSYYEDVLVVRVHPEYVGARRLPRELVTKHIWRDRFESINDFEKHLTRNGTVVRKFYLHVSRRKQAKRLLERLDDPAKFWKFNVGDLAERALWRRYRTAYADAIAATSHAHAPWYVVPADHKWFAHAVITRVLVESLEDLDLALPEPSAGDKAQLNAARRTLGGPADR